MIEAVNAIEGTVSYGTNRVARHRQVDDVNC